MSGGKDSIACLLTLLEAGVPAGRIECHHHDVDGAGPPFMDWPCTTAYCHAVAAFVGVPLYRSWREGGFLREMLRDGAPTAPVWFETPSGAVHRVGAAGPPGTRLRFPQVSSDLNQRWCSSYTKIDVMAAVIRAQERFQGCRTLIVTGERAQESSARAGYAVLEPHGTDARDGTRRRRHVDHWRPVHGLSEHTAWDLLRAHGIVPAPAYRLGWSRLSCIACIFGNADQSQRLIRFYDQSVTGAERHAGLFNTIDLMPAARPKFRRSGKRLTASSAAGADPSPGRSSKTTATATPFLANVGPVEV